jgi:hypothetical protein
VRADELEHGQAAVAADYGLAVEDARADGQRLNRFRDEREVVREVVAVAGEEPNGAPAPVREDPEAVVFDLMNPARGRRWLGGRSRQARIEAGTDCLARTRRRGSGVTDLGANIGAEAAESSHTPVERLSRISTTDQ